MPRKNVEKDTPVEVAIVEGDSRSDPEFVELQERAVSDPAVTDLLARIAALEEENTALAERNVEIEEQLPKPRDPNDPLWVKRAVRVDRTSTVRVIVRATPSTCLSCGFDMLVPTEGDEVPEWNELDSESQETAMRALQRHIRNVHGGAMSEEAIVDYDAIPKSALHKPQPV